MLGFIFGLNARLGRLHYFVASIVLAVVMTVLCVLLVFSFVQTGLHGAYVSREYIYATMKWPIIALTVLFCLASFTLQSMRIRDIGWDPVCVIPTWIAIMAVDFAVAHKFPGLALGPEHYGTVVGGLVNLVMTLALLFWPSGDFDGSAPDIGWTEPTPRASRATPATVERIARVTNSEFGRRTF